MENPLEDPEIDKIFKILFERLFEESERGAVIIGASVVEEYLEDYIKNILPESSNNYKNKLLKYPGVISTFSAKLELCYAFRLIDSNAYSSINELKSLRNLAAHAQTQFKLSEYEDKLNRIFDIGPNMINSIRKLGIELMMDYKMKGLDYISKKYKLSNEDKKKHIKESFQNKEITQKLIQQSNYWSLLICLTLLC